MSQVLPAEFFARAQTAYVQESWLDLRKAIGAIRDSCGLTISALEQLNNACAGNLFKLHAPEDTSFSAWVNNFLPQLIPENPENDYNITKFILSKLSAHQLIDLLAYASSKQLKQYMPMLNELYDKEYLQQEVVSKVLEKIQMQQSVMTQDPHPSAPEVWAQVVEATNAERIALLTDLETHVGGEAPNGTLNFQQL